MRTGGDKSSEGRCLKGRKFCFFVILRFQINMLISRFHKICGPNAKTSSFLYTFCGGSETRHAPFKPPSLQF